MIDIESSLQSCQYLEPCLEPQEVGVENVVGEEEEVEHLEAVEVALETVVEEEALEVAEHQGEALVVGDLHEEDEGDEVVERGVEPRQ